MYERLFMNVCVQRCMQTMDSHPSPEHDNEMTGGRPLYLAMLGSMLLMPKDARDAAPIPNKVDLAVSTCEYQVPKMQRFIAGTVATLWDTLMQSIANSSSQAKVSTNKCSIFVGLVHIL